MVWVDGGLGWARGGLKGRDELRERIVCMERVERPFLYVKSGTREVGG